MQIDISMTTDKEKFLVERWWASSPEFVVSSPQAQLTAAAAIWPGLKQYAVGKRRKPTDQPESTS